MATPMLRRGLPRVPGGEPWPPAGEVDGVVVGGVRGDIDERDAAASVAVAPVSNDAPGAESAPTAEVLPEVGLVNHTPAEDAAPAALRRGLPRVVGGEPWPPAVAPAPTAVAPAAPGRADTGPVSPASAEESASAPVASTAAAPAPLESQTQDAVAERGSAVGADGAAGAAVRRGLPRQIGGEPWPPADTLPAAQTAAASDAPPATSESAPASTPAEPASATASTPVEPASATAASEPSAAPVALLAASLDTPLPFARTVWDGRAPRRMPPVPAPAAASARPRPSWPQAIAVLMGAAALGVLAGAAVALVRTLLSVPFMQDFLATYPGEYVSPIAVEPGFAPWVGWQHFFNAFLIVLIIRSGLRVRSEKRPTAFWTPRNNPKGKISLTLWFHQALDILWIVNGVAFVVLLIVTGHWVRIVPTSWEVFPNALSAALQYVSFDWPHENGWNNYNSLQQLAYFATVFIAAPLAVTTGFRMSGLWPKKAERLSKLYPVEWARALHFPVMLYFVFFIIAHVALVMLTGFLRNLNHMYASQDAVTWTGFWVFVASLVVMAGGWFAARPLVIAPIAKAFGSVSGR